MWRVMLYMFMFTCTLQRPTAGVLSQEMQDVMEEESSSEEEAEEEELTEEDREQLLQLERWNSKENLLLLLHTE